MSDVEYIAEQMRSLHGQIEDLRRRLASVIMVGQVSEITGDKVRLTFDEADASTGEAFKGPLTRRASASGNAANGHKERNRPAMGETMAMLNPNGEIGPHSRLIPYGPTDDSGEPAGDDDFARVFQEGNARIAIKQGMIRMTVGSSGFELTETELKMLGTFRAKGGSRPAHYVGGVDDAGDSAVDGNPDVLI